MTVTVQSALDAVHASATRLAEAVQELVLIAVEDQPRSTESHLITVIHDAVLDIAAEAEQAEALLRANGQAGAAPQAGPFPAGASRIVAGCQAHVNAMGALLARGLMTPERLNDLAVLGRQHGREAGAWAKEIARCLSACQQLAWTDLQPAILAYWEETTGTDLDAPRELS
jgi:hypothetical protein